MSYFPSQVIPFKGLDLQSGKRSVDLWKEAFKPATTTGSLATGFEYTSPVLNQTQQAPAPVDASIESYSKWLQAFEPYDERRMERTAQLTSALNRQTLADLYPFMSAAGAEATARNLAASQAYRRFAEQLPSNVQNIMASKQAQAASAASAEAERQRATAAQQDAASRFAGRFAGQYIQVG